jgi:hypothetical protein
VPASGGAIGGEGLNSGLGFRGAGEQSPASFFAALSVACRQWGCQEIGCPRGAAVAEQPEELTGTVSDRIKASVTVLEFVSQCIDLKPTARGAVGLCPFHFGPLSRL